MHLLSEECDTSPWLSKCRREFALNAFSLGNSEPLQVFVHRLLSLRRWYNVPTCIKRIPLQSCPFKFYKCKESSCRMSHVSGDERAQKEGGLWHVSFTAGEVQPNWFKPQLLKVVPLPALSWACQRCCSCSVDLDTVSASPQEIRGLGFHQAPSLAGRSSSCPSPWGKGKDALLRSTCHLLLSSRRLHKLHREGFIWEDEMDFAIQSSYRTNCVWACVFVPVFSDPLLLSDILFPLSIWQLRLYLPLGRLFSTQETSFTNKQHLGSIWEMLPFS